MPRKKSKISVIIPAHNEEKSLERCVLKCRAAVGSLARPFEIIIAEDGSTDKTCAIAHGIAKQFSKVKLLHSKERLGKGGAINRAAKAAEGEILVLVDSDLATGLEYLPELVGWIDRDYDMAIGSRMLSGSRVKRSFRREAASRAYNFLVRLVLKSKIRDHQCGFKAMNKEKVQDVLEEVKDTAWFWDTELLVKAQREGLRIKEFPIRWTESDETRIRLFRDSLKMGTSVFALKRRLRGKEKKKSV